jgi:HK97 family phage prohead protease
MKIEVRADGAHISGYVNVTEKKSRPVITPRGKVIEIIEERAFEKALERAGNINVTVDHDNTHVYASTDDGTLNLYEDAIGLHADVIIKDENLIELAKKGKIKGWSFGMYNVVDEIEPRADDLPIRRVKSLDLDHLTLVINKNPVYSATSVELRAGEDIDIEERAVEQEVKVTIEKQKETIDYSEYEKRMNSLKVGN